ncbi:hypothetical protein [Mycolicibacterium phlei]
MPSRFRKLSSATTGRIVFGLIIASLPIEAAWFLHAGAEPYPAISQPPFQKVFGADGVFAGQSTSISAILADGSRVPVETKALFASSNNQALPVLASIAAHPDLDSDTRVAILTDLRRVVPSGDIAFLEITQQDVEYRVEENRRVNLGPPRVILIDLKDANDSSAQ